MKENDVEDNKAQPSALTLVAARLFVAGLICTPLVWFLWNDVMPTLFGLQRLTLLQSFELFLLCDVLFKGVSSRE